MEMVATLKRDFTPFWAVATGRSYLEALLKGTMTVTQVAAATGRSASAVQTALSHYRRTNGLGKHKPVETIIAGQSRPVRVRMDRQRPFRGRNSISDLEIHRNGTVSAVIRQVMSTGTRTIILTKVRPEYMTKNLGGRSEIAPA